MNCSTCELCQTKFDHPNFGDQCKSQVSASTPRPTRTHAPTMGNAASPGLGSGANHGFRDVRMTDHDKEVERPPASPEPNRKSQKPLIGSRMNNFRSTKTLTLSQGEPRDAAVNFGTYQRFQRHRAVYLPQDAFLVGLCLQTAMNFLSIRLPMLGSM